MAARVEHRLSLRPMVPDDLAAVDALSKEAFEHPWSEELLRRELEHDWSTVLLAVEESSSSGERPVERIVGFLVFWLVHDEIHILNIATLPAFRRRGAARALLAQAEKTGVAKGAVLATLEVRKSNSPAIALYEGLGYRRMGVRPGYYAPDGEDAIVMSKSLAP